MKLAPASGGTVIPGREKHSWRLAGAVTRSWSSCSSVTKNDTRRAIRCGLTETTCLSPHFRTNYSESQALGLGKQRWTATHAGEVGGGERALQPGSFCAKESSNSQLVVFCLTSDQSCAGFCSFVFYGCCGGSLRK